ncbi:pseudouridine synthase [Methylotenera versatilis]|uniref:Pseudouridine synthase n=1 Tax=Methylotenera versatilis (strain 301) TaxID=666681 RepID=D7DPG1_METV0|nr:pseudouridine synthase [Methylotenera versatilis]ADI29205.1 pseudouridine synthase [Methylotenera versatilis 301]
MARPFKTQRDPQATPRRPKTNFTKLDADPNAPPEPTQRLHKLLALAGLGSRRDMETLISSGRVTVNGAPATQGQGVTQFDTVRLDSRPVKLPFIAELPQVLIYHKPEGEIVSQDDPEGRASVFDKLPKVKNGKWIAIGRLDMNTSGLLIFTTSGELANRFMHPRYEVEREYAVRIFGELTEGQMTQLKEGIELEDGPANFDSISAQGGEGANHWYQVILREGRNREVRRLFEAFQLPVSRLMRVRFGPVNLPPRVKRGTMLKLEQKEVVGLLEWADLPVPSAPLRQLTQREKLKATTVFMPKVRKQRISALDRVPRTDGEPYSKKPSVARKEAPKKPAPRKSENRRVRQTSDLPAPDAQKAGMQKKSDRNRGRG